jgi:hypothetical protein
MANDLVESGKLVGASRQTVEALLGQPMYDWTSEGYTWMHYDLVHQSVFPAGSFFLPKFLFMNVDTWALDVGFKGEHVVKVEIRST